MNFSSSVKFGKSRIPFKGLLWIIAVLLVILTGSLFTGHLPGISNKFAVQDSPQCKNNSAVFAHLSGRDPSHLPFQLPDDPFSNAEESLEPEKLDEKDTNGQDWNRFAGFISTLISESVDKHFIGKLIKQLEQSIASRSLISLFMLYHCWKSFLI